jgi:hypothetical protein
VAVPAELPVKITEQTLELPELALSVQLVLFGETTPFGLAEKLTEPVGLLFGPELVSVTVTVQVLVSPTTNTPVPQSTTVLVVRVPAAATYGPTNGPPGPTGAAPAG